MVKLVAYEHEMFAWFFWISLNESGRSVSFGEAMPPVLALFPQRNPLLLAVIFHVLKTRVLHRSSQLLQLTTLATDKRGDHTEAS